MVRFIFTSRVTRYSDDLAFFIGCFAVFHVDPFHFAWKVKTILVFLSNFRLARVTRDLFSLVNNALSSLQIVGTLPKQWFSEQQQKTVPSLEALARYLATLAGSMQRSSAGCPEAERKKAR